VIFKLNTDLIKVVVILSVAALSMVLFTCFTPPVYNDSIFSSFSFVSNLNGDLPVYLSRFALSFLLLGIIPFLTAVILKEKPKSLGLRSPFPRLKWYLYLFFFFASLAAGFLGALTPDLFGYYPFSKTIVTLIGGQGIHYLFLHYVLYFFLYYVPWEFFFRGFLIFPFLKLIKENGENQADAAASRAKNKNAGIIAVMIFFQIIPSAMLHFGHPLSEQISAVAAGILFGFIAYRTKSIFPGLLVHATIGLSLDTFIIVRMLGMM
jgi:membrane protease YdiL (CAAX protease family)